MAEPHFDPGRARHTPSLHWLPLTHWEEPTQLCCSFSRHLPSSHVRFVDRGKQSASVWQDPSTPCRHIFLSHITCPDDRGLPYDSKSLHSEVWRHGWPNALRGHFPSLSKGRGSTQLATRSLFGLHSPQQDLGFIFNPTHVSKLSIWSSRVNWHWDWPFPH